MRTVKGTDSIPGNGEGNGEIGPGLGPDHIPVMINIKVSHGDNGCEVAVPSDSSFGNLKFVAGQKMGLKPEILKLLFRGIKKADDDNLETAGVKNNSKVSLIDDLSSEQKIPEEVKETSAISIGGAAAVAVVREDVDKLLEKVSAVKVVVDSGTKVDEKDILYLTEMLMRQLLKLDGIEAEGEGKVQRKQEVRRVQSLVETMDILKSKNSNITRDADNTESISTPGTVEPDSGSSTIPSPAPPSAPQSAPPSTSQPMPPSAPSPSPLPSSFPSQAPLLDPSVAPYPNTSVAPARSNLYPEVHSNPHVELHSNHYPDIHSNHYPDPHSNPCHVTHLHPYSAPHSNLYSGPYSSPYPMAYSGHYANPYSSYYHNYAEPHSTPYQVQYYAPPPPLSYSDPYPGQYTSPFTAAHNPYPYPASHSNSPYPPSAPRHPSYPEPHSDPYNVPSSTTNVTRDWEHFD